MKYETIKRPKGVNDILPADAHIFKQIEETAERTFSQCGYKEIRIPIFENSELFSRGIGEGTDVVEKEMYSFQDRGKRWFTLRPEGTASVVRLFIENKMYAASGINKLFYMGPMFRAERPQAGRYRQFHQIGAELFGPDSPWLDAEAIHMLQSFFEDLGIDDNILEINSVGCSKCRVAYREKLHAFLSSCKDKLCDECNVRTAKNPLRVFDCKNAECKSTTVNAPLLPDEICGECSAHFKETLEALDCYGVFYKKNPFLVRGLDYYTKTAFELVNSSLGAQNAIAGGGRYDGLVSLLGGPDVKGFGFALGVERLKMVLEAKQCIKPRESSSTFILILCREAVPRAVMLAKQIRKLGLTAELSPEITSLKSQMKKAGKANARFVVIIGEEEVKSGNGIVRNMGESSQEILNFDNIAAYIKSH